MHYNWSKYQLSTLLVLAMLAATTLVYWPGLGGGFAFDDFQNILNNPALHVDGLDVNDWIAAVLSSSSSSLQRPLAMLSFAINHYFTGLDPRPMKLTNLAIHLLNTFFVYSLVGSLLGSKLKYANAKKPIQLAWFAAFSAAFWALSPINVTAVLLVVQRMEILSHTFVFVGLWLYTIGRIRQQRGQSGWLALLGGLIPCTALGVLSKESAVLLPLYAFGLELFVFHFNGASNQRDNRLFVLFGFVLFIPATLAVTWLLPQALTPTAFSSRDFSLADRLMTEPRVLMQYLRWTILPDLGQMSLYHDDFIISRSLWTPRTTPAALLAIPGLIAVIWMLAKRRPITSLGLFWFLAAHLLTATFINLELVFEHRNYFASLGVSLALGDLLIFRPTILGRRQIFATLAVVLGGYCAATTYLRAQEWSDPVRFATSEAAKHPGSPRATYELARMLVIATNFDTKSPLSEDAWRALEVARSIPGSGLLPTQASLIFADRMGRPIPSDWWTNMGERLRDNAIGPQELLSMVSITNCVVEGRCEFHPREMLGMYEAALHQGPNPAVLSIYGKYALHVLHDRNLALSLWQAAVEADPGNSQFRINHTMLLIDLGRFNEASAGIEKLRVSGRIGQFSGTVEALEERMRTARELRSTTPK